MSSPFIHLHNHSHYSLLSALPKLPELISKAKEFDMPAIALTDNHNLYGAIEFYQACKKAEIKPIIGIDAYVAARTRHDKEAGIDARRSRLVYLAKNKAGYLNLINLVTDANLEGFYYKPRIDDELIEKYNDGLICISPSFSGDIAKALLVGDKQKAKERADFYKKHFGEDFYIEITHHPEIEGHEDNMKRLEEFSRVENIPMVAAHDTYYLNPEDRAARETLVSVGSHKSDTGGIGDDEDDFSFLSPEEIQKRFKDNPEAIENTLKIADKCNWEIELEVWKFPDYRVKEGMTADEELKELAYAGLPKREVEPTEEVKERIEYELKIIKDKGYSKYFLAVADILNFARDNHIFSTTRGSAAGSMVSYLTYITTIDPIEYNLPFERFLNPYRPSAPDIDMDLADNRRDEVIEYARRKYGRDHVAQIGTFGTMMARGSVRDTARAMGFSYGAGDTIAKLIPMGAQGFPMTIDQAMRDTKELRELYESDADSKTIIDMAKKIEGCARHIGVHAAGVVISPDPLNIDVPVQHDPKGTDKLITQYDMHSVGEDGVGLLKFDFLGIKNLSILADAVKLVQKIRGKTVDIEKIPIDDKKTFEMLARGETTGVFQLGGGGMTKGLTEMKPTVVDDINVMVALYRPGPMATIDEYIARKHGRKPTTYYHPKMKKFLEKTFGLLVYQDDLLYTAIELAGYDWKEVDKFRKAVGKKIPEEMAKQHKIFVDGCVKHSDMSIKEAEGMWDLFEPFQGYGFNKAHAACYGQLAYQTAYMKANFPVIYMAALLTADAGDTDKIAELVHEAKRMKIKVLPPDINESFGVFTVVENELRVRDSKLESRTLSSDERAEAVRFGLYSIKNFGEGIGDLIIEERKLNGPYRSLASFLERIQDRNLNKKSLDALIKSGALDAFDERGKMLANIEHLLQYNKEAKMSGEQDSLFGADDSTAELRLPEAAEATQAEKLAWEKDLLGLYLSGHPLEDHLDKFTDTITLNKITESAKNHAVVVARGMIESSREIVTKKGDKMMFAKLVDLTGEMELVAFPSVLAEFSDLLQDEKCIAVKGKLSVRNGEKSILVDKVKML